LPEHPSTQLDSQLEELVGMLEEGDQFAREKITEFLARYRALRDGAAHR
jgi:hypothetical protein